MPSAGSLSCLAFLGFAAAGAAGSAPVFGLFFAPFAFAFVFFAIGIAFRGRLRRGADRGELEARGPDLGRRVLGTRIEQRVRELVAAVTRRAGGRLELDPRALREQHERGVSQELG